MSDLRLHGIPNCDTVKKARAWLVSQGAAHVFIDFKKSPPEAAALERWAGAVGLESLLNRRGTAWRALDETARQRAETPAAAIALMQSHTSLVKRPVVEWPDGQVSVGFDPADWARRLA